MWPTRGPGLGEGVIWREVPGGESGGPGCGRRGRGERRERTTEERGSIGEAGGS